jgi:2-oxoglutarate dehydrogenase complex dehydrogenase (E1) component-like enzyme
VKYTGTKRFGLDGAEAMVPALEQIIKRGGQLGIKEIIIGMAHRGRLNVLANVMGKPHRAIFNEFKGGSFKPDDVEGSGDVKYHLGASSDRAFDGNTCTSRSPPTPRTWRSSIPWCSARCAPSRTSTAASPASARRCCRC